MTGALDRLKASFDAVVQLLTQRIDYLALYPAKVVSDHGDNTLELVPDDPRLPGLSRVPMRLGIPGVTIKVAAGSRVLLGFEGGDPTKPVATVWELSTLQEIVVTAQTQVTLGGTLLAEKVLKAETYRALEGPAMTLLATALTNVGAALAGGVGTVIALGATAATSCTAAAAGVTTLGPAADVAVLSGKVKAQ